jgi:hypothetical protein
MSLSDVNASNPELEAKRFEFEAEIRRAELKEKRAQRTAEEKQHHAENVLKARELDLAQGRGLTFTGAQATVAVALLALISGVIGGIIQAWATRDVEATKNQALVQIEQLKAQANIDLERQKQEAMERLDRAKFETTLILKATESPSREEQIRNLKFFLNAGFIKDPENKIASMGVQSYPSSPPQQFPTSRDEPQLRLVSSLPSNSPIRRIARPIGRVELVQSDAAEPSHLCTGWIFDHSHIITASFCVKDTPSDQQRKRLFRLGGLTSEEKGDVYELGKIIEVDESLGYAIMEIDPKANEKYGFLPMAIRAPELGEKIVIVQYGYGLVPAQRVTDETCAVIDLPNAARELPPPLSTEPMFAYKCPTDGGSAGAPVVAVRDGAVLGIHLWQNFGYEFAGGSLMTVLIHHSPALAAQVSLAPAELKSPS